MRGALLVLALSGVACGSSGTPKLMPDACAASTACADICNPGNSLGVGKGCIAGGGQCSSNMSQFLFCTDDYEPDGTGHGFCTGQCGSDAECGDGAFCSGSGMGAKGCVPATCGGTPST